jgi:hypothetical protein
MKGLSTEDKDHDSDEYLNKLEMITSNCPYVKRSFAHKKHNKSTHRINNINIISNLNKSELLRLSKESPKKVHNSLKSIYRISNNKSKKDIKKILLKNQLNLDKNKKNNIYTCALMKFYESPQIKDFNFYYEIPFTGKYDFIFLLRGGLSKTEWLEKTKKIRNFPRYLKNTLFFQSQLKLQDIHKCNFSKVYDIYMAIKNKALNLYTNRQYRECLEHFNYAYGLFKWIELKDKSIKLNDISSNENFSILDDNIKLRRITTENSNQGEEDLYKTSLIYILEILAYCYMEIRRYSNAVECLNECVKISGNLFPDVYLRRAQARISNKKISNEELIFAEDDINKALNLVLLHNSNIQKNNNNSKYLINPEIYYKVKNRYNQIIQKRLETKVSNIRKLLGNNLYKNELLFDNNNDSVLYIISQDNEKQYKILKEIKKKYNLAVKFFTETKNKIQLDLTYKEYESFYDIFNKFKFFYKFSINSLDKKVLEQLNDNEKKKLYNEKYLKIIEKNKIFICEYIFTHGNYNAELYKYVVDKLLEEEKNEIENKLKFNVLQNILSSKGKFFFIKILICFIIISFVSFGFQIYYMKNIRGGGLTGIDK